MKPSMNRFEWKVGRLTPAEKRLIEHGLRKYVHVFHDEESNDFKATDVVEHQILVENTQPIMRPRYRTTFALREELKAQVENILSTGIKRESSLPWPAPAILVPTKSQDIPPNIDFVWTLVH
jgi:hypothetical protein